MPLPSGCAGAWILEVTGAFSLASGRRQWEQKTREIRTNTGKGAYVSLAGGILLPVAQNGKASVETMNADKRNLMDPPLLSNSVNSKLLKCLTRLVPGHVSRHRPADESATLSHALSLNLSAVFSQPWRHTLSSLAALHEKTVQP